VSDIRGLNSTRRNWPGAGSGCSQIMRQIGLSTANRSAIKGSLCLCPRHANEPVRPPHPAGVVWCGAVRCSPLPTFSFRCSLLICGLLSSRPLLDRWSVRTRLIDRDSNKVLTSALPLLHQSRLYNSEDPNTTL
jgi:hypothetical protein